jgi:hypothetical protein
MVGRTEDWNRIIEGLKGLLDADSCGLMVIFGDYGMGKTFTLIKLDEAIVKNEVTGSNGKVVSVFLKALENLVPTNYLADILSRTIKKIGQENLQRMVKRIDFEAVNLDSTMRNIFMNFANGNSDAWEWLVGRALSNARLKEIGASYKNYRCERVKDHIYRFSKNSQECSLWKPSTLVG